MPWNKDEIISLLLEAGDLAMRNRRTIGWELKADQSLVTETDRAIEALLTHRKEARAAKDFARSDALREELAAAGVEVMDGDPLGWDWKLQPPS